MIHSLCWIPFLSMTSRHVESNSSFILVSILFNTFSRLLRYIVSHVRSTIILLILLSSASVLGPTGVKRNKSSKSPSHHIYKYVFSFFSSFPRLDKALIRPGRVDMKEMVGFAGSHQLTQMFKNFYPEAPFEMAHEFANRVMESGQQVSAAQVQGFFMLHKTEPHIVIENAGQVIDV